MSNVVQTFPAVFLAKYLTLFLYSVVGELICHQSRTQGYRDQDGNTPLHLACRNGHLEVAKKLLTRRLLSKEYANTIHCDT